MLLTDVSSERAVRALQKAGFTVPRHKRLNPYTLRSIIRDAGLTDQDFRKLLA